MKRALVMVMSLAAITFGILLVNEFGYLGSASYTHSQPLADSEWCEISETFEEPISFEESFTQVLPAKKNAVILDNDYCRITMGDTRYTKTLLYFIGYYDCIGELNVRVQYTDGTFDEFHHTMTNFAALRTLYLSTINKTIDGIACVFTPKECTKILTGESECAKRLSQNTIVSKSTGILELYNNTGTVVGNFVVNKNEMYIIDASTIGYTLYQVD